MTRTNQAVATTDAIRDQRRSYESLGPGAVALDPSYVPQPVCGFILEALPEPLATGFAESFARHGLLLDVVDVAFIEGFMYNQLRVVGAPPKAVVHPPRKVRDRVLSGRPPIREQLDTAARARVPAQRGPELAIGIARVVAQTVWPVERHARRLPQIGADDGTGTNQLGGIA